MRQLLLLLVDDSDTTFCIVRICVALVLLNEARVQQHHAFVHDLQVRGHQLEVTYELLANQTVHLFCTSYLYHETLILPLKVLSRHHKVTKNDTKTIMSTYPECVVKISTV